jgi:hypothetical protein
MNIKTSGKTVIKSLIVEKNDDSPFAHTQPKEATIFADDRDISIRVEGYSDACSLDGCGTPILIERWEGELRVVIWGDINQEDPTHIISLEGARESKRKGW